MQPDVDHYQGREQSFIKHLFLQKYLENAAFKLFQGRSPVFNFVDAFAGPWKVSDSRSLSDTSFDLALKTLESVRHAIERSGVSNLKVRFRLCERDPDRFAILQKYAENKTQTGFDIRVFCGVFEDIFPISVMHAVTFAIVSHSLSSILPDGTSTAVRFSNF